MSGTVPRAATLARGPLPGTARPRVMQVVLSLSPGGTERLVIEIVRRLAPRTDVSVCCLDEPGAWAGELASCGVPVQTLGRGAGFRPALGYRLARMVKSQRVQVIHCHHYSPFVYGQLAALLQPGLRVVFTEHGRLGDQPPSRKRQLVNPWLGRLPARMFAVSQDLRHHMIAEGLPAHRIEVVYNGIDPGLPPTPAQRTRARRAMDVPDEALVVGTVGRLDPVKDLATLLRALALAAPRIQSPVRLVVAGGGSELAALTALAQRLEVGGLVRFTGYRSDVRTLMPGFDLYVNSSIHEGVSLTILEAMASGVPVIATRAGGNAEVVVHGRTGLVVPVRSPEALADAMATLAGAAQQRGWMGRAGRARVIEQFSIDRMVQRYEASYGRDAR